MPIDNPALEADLDRRLSGLSLSCQSLQQVEQDHSKKRKGEDRFCTSPPRKFPSLEASAQPPVMQSSPDLVEVARSLSSDDSGFESDLLSALMTLLYQKTTLPLDFEAAGIKAFRTVFPGINVTDVSSTWLRVNDDKLTATRISRGSKASYERIEY
ncbi:hypothetical protein QR680_014382 [Steinernema hermaphroditum]|uniref:Uncharacterized protein n=1 Tax=Steinernema hermaphroditum TaxID=289476 RepID=A0AA39IAA2_9BILA|nr:hypothetical protein QR680_014382 [Steinernema hermaphroditum]